MYQTKTDQDLIHALEQSGSAPPPDLIAECLARQASLTPALLQLLRESLHDAWDDVKDPRWYRLRHAGKLLIAYREPEALPIFERMYTSLAEQELDVLEWFETDLAHYGETAVATLLRIANLQTGEEYHYGRGLAADTLSEIARQHPETRDEIIAGFQAQLPPLRADGTPDVPPDRMDLRWTHAAIALGELADPVSQPQIQALFLHDLIEESFINLEGYHRLLSGEGVHEPEPFDILREYERAHEFEQGLRNREARTALLRQQGFRPPVPPAAPLQSRAADWFNDKLLGKAKNQQVGRNDPCPCGSGLKYKKCHGRPGSPPL